MVEYFAAANNVAAASGHTVVTVQHLQVVRAVQHSICSTNTRGQRASRVF